MATVPSPATGVTGATIPAAFWNAQVRDSVNFFVSPVLCVTRATVVQSIPNAAWTGVLFDTNEKDADNGHSTTTNTSRYTSQTAGWYEAVGANAHAANAAGNRGVRLAKNGAPVPGRAVMGAASGASIGPGAQVTGMVYLAVNDYVEIQVYQDSGAALNTATVADLAPYMHVRWISK